MASINPEHLSPFGRSALKLDGDFSELVRIGGQLQRLELDSDSGLEHAIKLLGQFAQHGQAIAAGIQDFSRSLQELREKSEAAAKLVSERAQAIQQRKQLREQIREKLARVEDQVKA